MVHTPIFDLDTGRLCLDFANTLGDRTGPEPREERLHRYADLVAFGEQAGVLTGEAAALLLEMAEQRPDAAERTFADAIAFREVLYRVFSAVAADTTAAEDDLAAFNAAFAAAVTHARIVSEADGFRWEWPQDAEELDAMLWPIAWSAVDLLRAPEVHRVHECAGHDCSWLFLDMSKNGSRRWCSMETCGNRAKAHRHRVLLRTGIEKN
jgi:predicted RNA-binding Zn ribbon-like protein